MTTDVYTDKVTANLVERYNEVRDENYEARTVVVQAIADELEVEKNSVIGKLVSEKIYVAKVVAKTAKTATRTKEDYVAAFEAATGIDELGSFVNARKDQLEALWNFLVTTSDQFNADRGLTVPEVETVVEDEVTQY